LSFLIIIIIIIADIPKFEKSACLLGLYRIRLFQIRPEPDLPGFRNSNPAGAGAESGFGENLFEITEQHT